MNESTYNQRCAIGNTSFSVLKIDNCLDIINNNIVSGNFNYICVADARTMYWANKSFDLYEIQNKSLLSVPDGMSLVRYAKKTGIKSIERITGHDLMIAIFNESFQKSYSHYFYGNTQETLNKLKINLLRNYPNLKISGVLSPPFQLLKSFDIDELAQTINDVSPTFFWCGLGSPKQERFISLLQPKLKSTICVGVGQAFYFIAGTDKRAPKWMQRAGFEWFFLYIQKPKKLLKAIFPYIWMMFMLFKVSVFNNKS
jgi:N-acetylglucosaminyldiphosphoundecaprenol N-acetyl-beta-D-mannosaminyltransferase